jgi:hypothetical protein
MRPLTLFLIGTYLCTGTVGSHPSANDPDPKVAPVTAAAVDEQIRDVLRADTPSGASYCYRLLFKTVGKEGLRRLQVSPHDGIAIQSAWEELELTIPEKRPPNHRPEHDKLVWFLGFLEGRGRLRAPQWWADALIDARANARHNVYFDRPDFKYIKTAPPDPAMIPPPRARFEEKDGNLTVRVGAESAALPKDFRSQIKASNIAEGISALITPGRCYVAIYDEWGFPYKLACVDRKSLQVKWTRQVWGSWWAYTSGASHQWIELTEQGDRVVVFGAAGPFHVEAFRVDDGSTVFRFSNSY